MACTRMTFVLFFYLFSYPLTIADSSPSYLESTNSRHKLVLRQCVSGTSVTVDGDLTDWPGYPSCPVWGEDGCTQLVQDPRESDLIGPTEVQPQWDITGLWGTDDGDKAYIGFETVDVTQWESSEFVRVCLDHPTISDGQAQVSGCNGIVTDFLIYITQIGSDLVGSLVRCGAGINNCNFPIFSLNVLQTVTLVNQGPYTELSFPLSSINATQGYVISVMVYIDNNNNAKDDSVPDSGSVGWFTGDCTPPPPPPPPPKPCVEGYTIKVDGDLSDWPGFPTCDEWGVDDCTELARDERESDVVGIDEIQPQWDILGLWATDDEYNAYIGFNTAAPTSWETGGFVKICLDLSSEEAGQTDVNGCEVPGFTTDYMIFITEGFTLTGVLVRCGGGSGNDCNNHPVYLNIIREIPLANYGNGTELSFPLSAIGAKQGDKTNITLYFDNNGNPKDDVVPDWGLIGWETADCPLNCTPKYTVEVDGFLWDFPGYPECTIGDYGCTLLVLDEHESEEPCDNPVQPQWDIDSVWAADDADYAYIGFSTVNDTDYDGSQFVRICFDLPDVVGGQNDVSGCLEQSVDYMVYLIKKTEFTAKIFRCGADYNDCNKQIDELVPENWDVKAAYNGSETEVSFPLDGFFYQRGQHISLDIFFDNNDLATDDEVSTLLPTSTCYEDCVKGATIELDGNLNDWPGFPFCPQHGKDECTLLIADEEESNGLELDAVRPQWDVVDVFATNDKDNFYIGFNTVSVTQWSAGEFVRICLDVDTEDGQGDVNGCRSINVDYLIYISNAVDNVLHAWIARCGGVSGNDCNKVPIELQDVKDVTLQHAGTDTEISFPLDSFAVNEEINVVLYFDNSDNPKDDSVPNEGYLIWRLATCDHVDCFGVPHGNATKDECGVCGGDGSSCACQEINIEVDGDGNDWPGHPDCDPAQETCSKIASDSAESLLNLPNGIQPQWDLVSIWGADDGVAGYIRYDTYADTDYEDAEFVRICLDVHLVGPGVTVSGCEAISTDYLVFVSYGLDHLTASLVDCNLPGNKCDKNPFFSQTIKDLKVAHVNRTTEISFLLEDIGVHNDTQDCTDVVIYFDNNALPSDDTVPDSSFECLRRFQCHPKDCFGIPGGNATVDSCGVCGGDGTSCLPTCAHPPSLVVDGDPIDWPGHPLCNIGDTLCGLIETDPAESKANEVNGIRPQWDFTALWGWQDRVHGYLRYDTVFQTQYSNSEFVRICINVPSKGPGQTVSGCGTIETDYVIFIGEGATTGTLNAWLIDCNLSGNNCNQKPQFLQQVISLPVASFGKTTEVSFELEKINLFEGDTAQFVLYFDNNGNPKDDTIPDENKAVNYTLPFCPECAGPKDKWDLCGVCNGNNSCVDCLGHPYGNATVDQCGVCEGNNDCIDCKGVPNGGKTVDACGVCGGNGKSCTCANSVQDPIVIDGDPTEWPGSPSCKIGSLGCSKVAHDPAESTKNTHNGIEPQWDIVSVWGADDGTRAYLRFDTKSNTVWDNAEFVKICLDVPGVNGIQAINGCPGLSVDYVIYITRETQLTATLINCASNNCNLSPFFATNTFDVSVANYHKVTELKFKLHDINVQPGDYVKAIIFFDNNCYAEDDNVPNNEYFIWPFCQ